VAVIQGDSGEQVVILSLIAMIDNKYNYVIDIADNAGKLPTSIARQGIVKFIPE
jgi:hypothetical protein